MPGPIFMHVQTFSHKVGKAGNNVHQVIGEATRTPEFSKHVDNPKPPRVIEGDPSIFRALHDAHVAEHFHKGNGYHPRFQLS